MSTIEHKNITEANLHEPKGISAATIDKVYVSDGAGSGAWQKIEASQMDTTALPEPKGVAAATANKVYVSDGAGSGAWQQVGSAQITGLNATFAEINSACDISARSVSAGTGLTIVEATHAGKMITLDALTGSSITLPVATGSGAIYTFTVKTLATSNSHSIRVANASGLFRGVINTIDTDSADAVASWGTAVDSDTITLNRTTTGSVYVGETIVITDVATNVFAVSGFVAVTGAPATPFSATV